jgi:hypothetical protein
MDLIGVIGYCDLVSMALIVQKENGKPGDEGPTLAAEQMKRYWRPPTR